MSSSIPFKARPAFSSKPDNGSHDKRREPERATKPDDGQVDPEWLHGRILVNEAYTDQRFEKVDGRFDELGEAVADVKAVNEAQSSTIAANDLRQTTALAALDQKVMSLGSKITVVTGSIAVLAKTAWEIYVAAKGGP